MSGIAGLWNLDGQPAEPTLLADLGAALAHRGGDGEGVWTEGSVGLVCRLARITPESLAEHQPVVGAWGDVLVFDGRLDNRAELLGALDGAVDRGAPDSDLVLAAHERFGDRFVERLAGDFALALFDPRRQRLFLARDPIGVRPLYYHHGPRLVAFASEIKALLAHPAVPARPDDEHLANFLLGDIRVWGARTFFEGLLSLPPATIAVVTPSGLTTRRYWDFDRSRRVSVRSFPECAAAFHHHFAEAVRRRMRSAQPVGVSVSGGLDSSSIFCLAHAVSARAAGPGVVGVSYTPPAGSPADERAFLTEIERQCGLTIDRLPIEPMGLLNASRGAVWTVEAPFLDEQWHTTVALLGAVRRHGCRVLLTGHWGDQMLFNQAYLIDLVHGLAWRQARAHLAEYGRWLTDADPRWFRRRFVLDLVKYSAPDWLLPVLRGLRPRPRRAWYGARLRNRLRPRPWREAFPARARATAHARALYEQARSGYHVLCMEWNNKVAAAHGLEMTFPFLDRDLLAFLMALPGEILTWQGVPKALLREAMRGTLPEAIVARTWKADFTSLVNEGMARDFSRAAPLAADGLAANLGYLDRDVLRRDLERVRQGLRETDARAAWSLSDVLGLELWLRVFIDGERPRASAPLHAEAQQRGAERRAR